MSSAEPRPAEHHALSDALVEVIAERFRVLGEPMRIRILDRLRDGEATVGRLADDLGTTQQNVSKHLSVLAAAGLVARRKRGNAVVCSIADPSVFDLCERVCDGLARRVAALQEIVGPAEGAL
ncbi:MAG TPA: metalloregulator ArsR/SmtB family transcription factor [Miltoncostaeaceae bacterium]|jgi:DNA-binding transcriptional ArsR family regulator|nr:metalloregulator ArsR/SmtB family transcription factor [Miltoncostaeaceae bacterium]